jgi:hypothetical protein
MDLLQRNADEHWDGLYIGLLVMSKPQQQQQQQQQQQPSVTVPC